MSIVTLTTDFGTQDYFLPAIKGAILSAVPQARLIDITHAIAPYDIVQAAFIFKTCWRRFPKGTIHLISVNDFYSPSPTFLAFEQDGHYFVGPDNGIFSLIFEESPNPVFVLPVPPESPAPIQDIYAQTIGHISNEQPLEDYGTPAPALTQRITFQPVTSADQIKGSIIYIDHYENAITNIQAGRFEQIGKNRTFALFFKRHDPIRRLSVDFQDVAIGEPLCRINSAGYLEIAVNMGKAASLLGLHVGDGVQIDFSPNS
jgi:S-adenosylmethionine hydrolase